MSIPVPDTRRQRDPLFGLAGGELRIDDRSARSFVLETDCAVPDHFAATAAVVAL